MRFEDTELEGVWVVELEPVSDERGWFARAFSREEFVAHGLEPDIVHANVSFNARAGTLRGMHHQADPHGEAKLIRCTRGSIFDVAVDVREGSPTRARWVGVELSANNGRMLYVSAGLAHGFQTLEDESEVSYLMSHEYAQSHARGVRWDDPAFGIEWPDAERTISDRDRAYEDFA